MALDAHFANPERQDASVPGDQLCLATIVPGNAQSIDHRPLVRVADAAEPLVVEPLKPALPKADPMEDLALRKGGPSAAFVNYRDNLRRMLGR